MDFSPFLQYGAIGLSAILAVILLLLLRDNMKERKEMRGESRDDRAAFTTVLTNHLAHLEDASRDHEEAAREEAKAMRELTSAIDNVCRIVDRRDI